jgi:hypothetical protein
MAGCPAGPKQHDDQLSTAATIPSFGCFNSLALLLYLLHLFVGLTAGILSVLAHHHGP